MSDKSFTAPPKRRQWREKRGNALRQMNDGTLDEKPLTERWSREGKKEAKRKKLKPLTETVPQENQQAALILEVHRRSCLARLLPPSVPAEIKAFYRAKSIDEEGEFPAVGDNVIISASPSSPPLRASDNKRGLTQPVEIQSGKQIKSAESEHFILKILPRKSVLTRPGPRTRESQILVQAANIDQVVLVMSIENPPFNFGFADRFLLAASLNKLPFLLVINKCDLSSTPLHEQIPQPQRHRETSLPSLQTKRGSAEIYAELPPEIQEFSVLAADTIFTSAASKEGIADLIQNLSNKVSVFSGQSGVGKSSLINAIAPNAEQTTAEVRAKDGKGRHTTVAASYIDLPEGGAVIDTPGIRALGIANLEASDLARCFPGFFKDDFFDCKFKDCKHTGEPDCAVQARIKKGEISPARYKSYLRILSSLSSLSQ